MRELLPFIKESEKKHPILVMARVISTWGSSPRPVGSVMFIAPDGELAGSVSGGCVEGEVVKLAQEVFRSGKSRKVDFGVSDENAWSVGLSCGGKLEVFLEKLDLNSPLWQAIIKCLESNQPAVMVTSLSSPENQMAVLKNQEWLGDTLTPLVEQQAEEALRAKEHRQVEEDGESFFVQVIPKRELLIITGAAHLSAELVAFAVQFDFETVVIDPREYFSTHVNFAVAPDRLLTDYPSEVLPDFALDQFTYCAVLSHDPKIDDDALQFFLSSDVAYIGALGGRKSNAKRVERLKELGFSEDQIARITAPIGLKIHAKTPREIALAIMAQIIEVRNSPKGEG